MAKFPNSTGHENIYRPAQPVNFRTIFSTKATTGSSPPIKAAGPFLLVFVCALLHWCGPCRTTITKVFVLLYFFFWTNNHSFDWQLFQVVVILIVCKLCCLVNYSSLLICLHNSWQIQILSKYRTLQYLF